MNRRAILKALGLAPLAPLVAAIPVAATVPVKTADVTAGVTGDVCGWTGGFLLYKDRKTGIWYSNGIELTK